MKQAERSRARCQALLGAAQIAGAPVLLKEQRAGVQWQGSASDIADGLIRIGVDFRAQVDAKLKEILDILTQEAQEMGIG